MPVHASHARFVVTETLGLQYVGYLIFVHPHLETVPVAVWSQAPVDRDPACDCHVFAWWLAGTGAPGTTGLVRDHQAIEAPREGAAAEGALGICWIADESWYPSAGRRRELFPGDGSGPGSERQARKRRVRVDQDWAC